MCVGGGGGGGGGGGKKNINITCMSLSFFHLIALVVGSASFEEGGAGTMPGQVCATLTYNPLSVPIGGFSTPATVTFTTMGAGGAGKYLTIRSP